MPLRPPDLLAGSIVPTLVRLASPNVLGLLAQTLTIAYDGYIVARLGTAALAAVALVFPPSRRRAAMGGGVAAAVALGAGSAPRAAEVAWHGLAIECALGLAIGAALLAGGPALYAAMGGRGEALALAQAYAAPLFAAGVRGRGQRLPALCLTSSALLHVALCPLLVFGLGPVPPLGIAGASLSFVALNACFAGGPGAPGRRPRRRGGGRRRMDAAREVRA
ncbi:MAG: hypothetical protein IPI73_10640 [Betaproteobacteria bacterium]|nr:hypothetical protein [Betaproteobacteria bacterium]